MMPTSETEIREMLRRRAGDFSMATEPSPTVVRRIRKRTSGRLALTAAGLSSVGLVVGLFIATLGATAPENDVGAGSASRTSIKLVSYLLPDDPTGVPGSSSEDELRAHVECMRAQGFDLPDAVRTASGWTIAVDPALVDIGSPGWREAAFVTCRFPLPASGNFILGLSQERVERFVACVREQGFELPEPTLNADGEYVFDLTGTNIDMSLPEWSKAAFVTCSPDDDP
jgi:hypothetical protein